MTEGIAVTGTIGILKASCLDGALTSDDAHAILADMVCAGDCAPVLRVSDLLG